MKKHALISLLMTLPGMALADVAIVSGGGASCGESEISLRLQTYTDNEFLYDADAWKTKFFPVNGVKTTSGMIFECDNSHCSAGTIVRASAGSVFQGSTLSQETCFKCDASGGDSWDIITCPGGSNNLDTGNVNFTFDVGLNNRNECFFKGGNFRVGEWFFETPLAAGQKSYVTRQDCFNKGAVAGDHADKYYARCDQVGNAYDMHCVIATCEKGYSLKSGQCIKINTSNGNNNVIAPNPNTPEPNIPNSTPDNNNQPDGDTSPVVSTPDQNVVIKTQLNQRIDASVAVLDKIKSDFEVSRWKDADGNFNTSRLVSDSVAGVVLGTAGGLITSNVIKKNQVKNGFDDISCTVGGQVVAGWDDQFSVGIR